MWFPNLLIKVDLESICGMCGFFLQRIPLSQRRVFAGVQRGGLVNQQLLGDTASQPGFFTWASSRMTRVQTNSPLAQVGFVKMPMGQLVKKPLERGFGLEARKITS